MATSPVAVAQPTLEDRILKASAEADAIVAEFNPGIANLVAEGIAVEPIISGLVKTIAALFHRHTVGKK